MACAGKSTIGFVWGSYSLHRVATGIHVSSKKNLEFNVLVEFRIRFLWRTTTSHRRISIEDTTTVYWIASPLDDMKGKIRHRICMERPFTSYSSNRNQLPHRIDSLQRSRATNPFSTTSNLYGDWSRMDYLLWNALQKQTTINH